MDCTKARNLLPAAALGDLDESRARELEAHCSVCRDCRQEFEDADALLLVLNREADQPGALTERVVAAGRSELRSHAPRARAWRGVAILTMAAACAVFGVGISFMNPTDPAPASSGSWRFVLGDAGNSRFIQVADVPDLNQVRKREHSIPELESAYKPLAWGGMIFVGAPIEHDASVTRRLEAKRRGCKLLALEVRPSEVRVRWSHTFPNGDFYKMMHFPDRCILDGRLYVTDGERCLVLDAQTGKRLDALQPPRGVKGWGYLTASHDALVGVSRDGRAIFSVHAPTGETRWMTTTEGRVHIPAMLEDKLYFQSASGRVAALDIATGSEAWSRSTPSLDAKAGVYARDNCVLVVARNGRVAAFEPASGRSMWEKRMWGAFGLGVGLASDTVYLRGGRRVLSIAAGEPVWDRQDMSGQCAPPTIVGERVFTTGGRTAGGMNEFTSTGHKIAALKSSSGLACEGIIVSDGLLFTIGDGRLVTLERRRN